MAAEPSWDLYRSFLAVLEHGSLSAAARNLGLTQPTVGRHVAALEQTLGAQLFTRSASGLLLTEVARDLEPYARTLAATSASLLRAASGKRDEVAGTVRISASEVIAVEVLPPILAKLQDAHPALHVELSASDAIADLLHREVDVAVRMAEPAQGALIARRIGDLPVGLFAHRRYVERHGAPRTLADLASHRLVGVDRQTAYIRAMVKRHPMLEGLVFSFRADNNLAQLAAIRAGAGIGMCQTGVVAGDPDLVRLLPRAFELPLPAWVAMHENLKGSPRCRVTFDALVAGLQAYLAKARR